MASGQTEHYGLNQWEARDQVLREEFNADNRKLDEALAQLSASIPRLVFGTYTGDGASSQYIDLGAAPRAVFVSAAHGAVFYHYNATDYYWGGMALAGAPVTTESGSYEVLAIQGTGFSVFYGSVGSGDYIHSNKSGTVYYYMALI